MCDYNALRRLIPLVLVTAASAATAVADVRQNTWAGIERVVAVGDVHGDYDQFVKTLTAAKLIDDKLKWIGGATHLVQVGDMLDRGPDSRKVMDLLMKLETAAPDAGGAVHVLIGNHEVMVLLGKWRFVHPGEKAAFGGEKGYRAAMSKEGTYGRWLRRLNAIIKINDVLYCHGGLSPTYAGKPLDEINEAVRAHLDRGGSKGIAMSTQGPCWYRHLATADEATVQAEVTQTLAKHRASRIVIGHTVSPTGIAARAGGRVIMIDVGLSAAYGGPACCLEINPTGLYRIFPDKTEKLDLAPPAENEQAA